MAIWFTMGFTHGYSRLTPMGSFFIIVIRRNLPGLDHDIFI